MTLYQVVFITKDGCRGLGDHFFKLFYARLWAREEDLRVFYGLFSLYLQRVEDGHDLFLWPMDSKDDFGQL